MFESKDIEDFINHSSDPRVINYLEAFRKNNVSYKSIVVQALDDHTLELIATCHAQDENWTAGAVQYYLNTETGELKMGWHEHPMPIPQAKNLTLYIHGGGFRIYGGAAKPVEKINYSVDINGEEVFQCAVVPPLNDQPKHVKHRKKMAEYQEVQVAPAPVYEIVVRNDKKTCESIKELKTTKSLWIHINFEIKLSPNGQNNDTSIAIEINDKPQSYR